jgi:hypothetical protein
MRDLKMEAYDHSPIVRRCADGHGYVDEREHFREVAHAWDDIPAYLRGLTDFRAEPQGPAEVVAGTMAGLAVEPAPDLTAVRALLRRVRAAGWEHVVYGVHGTTEHVWRRREDSETQQVSLYGHTLEFKHDRASQASVTISHEWNTGFDLAEVTAIAELLGFLPRVWSTGTTDPASRSVFRDDLVRLSADAVRVRLRTERVEIGVAGCFCPVTEEQTANGSSVAGTERTEHRPNCWNAPVQGVVGGMPCTCGSVTPEVIGHDRDCPARYAPRLAYRTEKASGA